VVHGGGLVASREPHSGRVTLDVHTYQISVL
jgi:hypothetical protein